jgi:hypothetical protein
MPADRVFDVPEGQTVSLAVPPVTGFRADQSVVSVTCGTQDTEITVWYTRICRLTIHYTAVDPKNQEKMPADHIEEVEAGKTYSVSSPEVKGLTADQKVIRGTMGTEDVTATVTYTDHQNDKAKTGESIVRVYHRLFIIYVYEDGTQAANAFLMAFEEGSSYSVESPSIPGYTPDIFTVSGIFGTDDITVTVTYKK